MLVYYHRSTQGMVAMAASRETAVCLYAMLASGGL